MCCESIQADADTAGAKRKPVGQRENEPLPEDEIWDITLPLPEAPPSSSKRPRSRCHYHDIESSPSKKSREGTWAIREPVHFEECRLLFGNATNSKIRSTSDDFDLGENVRRPKAAKKASKPRIPTSGVEMVLELRSPSRKVLS